MAFFLRNDIIWGTPYINHYLVVRGKSFLIETETEEDEANVDVSAGYDESNEGGFRRALRPKTKIQNKNCPIPRMCHGWKWPKVAKTN